MWRLTLPLALLLLFQSAALGFVPVNRQSVARQSAKRHQPNAFIFRQSQQLWMSEIDNDENQVNASASSEEEETPTPEMPLPKPKEALPSPALQQAMRFLDNVYYVFVISAGTFFACGLLLNLFGFGWAFTKDGFKVDTIDHMRLEHQFEKAARQLASESRPPSSLPK